MVQPARREPQSLDKFRMGVPKDGAHLSRREVEDLPPRFVVEPRSLGPGWDERGEAPSYSHIFQQMFLGLLPNRSFYVAHHQIHCRTIPLLRNSKSVPATARDT